MKTSILVATLLVVCLSSFSVAGTRQQTSSGGEATGKIAGKFLNADTKKAVFNIEIKLRRANSQATLETVITQFRADVGEANLSYGIAYFPFLITTLLAGKRFHLPESATTPVAPNNP